MVFTVWFLGSALPCGYVFLPKTTMPCMKSFASLRRFEVKMLLLSHHVNRFSTAVLNLFFAFVLNLAYICPYPGNIVCKKNVRFLIKAFAQKQIYFFRDFEWPLTKKKGSSEFKWSLKIKVFVQERLRFCLSSSKWKYATFHVLVNLPLGKIYLPQVKNYWFSTTTQLFI